jgi:hypothetical protein
MNRPPRGGHSSDVAESAVYSPEIIHLKRINKAGFEEEPTIGLEPMTSFLPRMCSTD